ncbi:hypothetical protein [Duganella radicis]|uniref:Uncharacterized protein n=1 Tax=Duganella radicis TaxID=551988 RepID=A0A6L6PBQ9_9BURK|nr:hypothetical protein [Duganella radicis]MTV36273.1 hypothetical protein [Duganella radicis]
MAAVKTKLGRIPCDCCGHLTVLKQNEAGTLTMGCDECDVSSFAKKGTAAAGRWLAKLPPAETPPAPAEQPSGTVPKAPAQQPAGDPPAKPKKAAPFDPLGYFAKGVA